MVCLSGPVCLLAPRQGGPRQLWRSVGQGMGVAESHDPLIVHHQKIENRQLEVGITGASANLFQSRTGCEEKLLELFFIRGKPAQHLQCKHLSGFLLIFHGEFCPIRRPDAQIGRLERNRKGFLN